MTSKEETSTGEKNTAPDQNTPCPDCNGAGVILTNDTYRAGSICCDQCETGRAIWSRMLELLTDVDTPSPVRTRPEPSDSIVRNRFPRRHTWPPSEPTSGKTGR